MGQSHLSQRTAGDQHEFLEDVVRLEPDEWLAVDREERPLLELPGDRCRFLPRCEISSEAEGDRELYELREEEDQES